MRVWRMRMRQEPPRRWSPHHPPEIVTTTIQQPSTTRQIKTLESKSQKYNYKTSVRGPERNEQLRWAMAEGRYALPSKNGSPNPKFKGKNQKNQITHVQERIPKPTSNPIKKGTTRTERQQSDPFPFSSIQVQVQVQVRIPSKRGRGNLTTP